MEMGIEFWRRPYTVYTVVENFLPRAVNGGKVLEVF
jgi:hypothetical protein